MIFLLPHTSSVSINLKYVIRMSQADFRCAPYLEVVDFKPRLGDRLSGLRLFRGFRQPHRVDIRTVLLVRPPSTPSSSLSINYLIIGRILIRAVLNKPRIYRQGFTIGILPQRCIFSILTALIDNL